MLSSNLFEGLILLLACSVYFAGVDSGQFLQNPREIVQIVGGQNA